MLLLLNCKVGELKVPNWGYSTINLDPDRTVRASGRELRVSPKAAREVCDTIRGMKVEKAKDFLQQVIRKRKPVPFKRHIKKGGHRRGLVKSYAGGYPVKAAAGVLKVLENAETNADYKGFDIERLRIIHAAAYHGVKIRKYIPRAFGRATPYFKQLCHVELVLEQMEAF